MLPFSDTPMKEALGAGNPDGALGENNQEGSHIVLNGNASNRLISRKTKQRFDEQEQIEGRDDFGERSKRAKTEISPRYQPEVTKVDTEPILAVEATVNVPGVEQQPEVAEQVRSTGHPPSLHAVPFGIINDTSELGLYNKADHVDLYFDGQAKIVEISAGQDENPVMAITLSHELLQKIQRQLIAGQHYKTLKASLTKKLKIIDEESHRIEAEYNRRVADLQEAMDKLAGRAPDEEEKAEGQVMMRGIHGMEPAREKLKVEREDCLKQLYRAREIWITCAAEVQAVHTDVFYRAKIVPASAEADAVPPEQLPIGGNPNIGAITELEQALDAATKVLQKKANIPSGPQEGMPYENERARIILKTCTARVALQAAHEKHDTYRISYRIELAQYTTAQVNKPRNVDIREEFSRKWIAKGRAITQEIARAEKALKDAEDEAIAANVTVPDPQDDSEPNTPYDDELFAKYLINTLDRKGIESWLWAVEENAGVGPPPVKENEEPEKAANERRIRMKRSATMFWEQTLEQHRKTELGSATSPSLGQMVLAGIKKFVPGLGRTQVGDRHRHDVVSKESEGDEMAFQKNFVFVSTSERAYGKKKGRIEAWAEKMTEVRIRLVQDGLYRP